MNNPEDQFSQSFKRKILAEDRERMSSYLDHARASADDLAGGRFAKVNPTTVTGTSPISYPAQPPGSPWAKDEMPPEPLIDGTGEGNRLGYAIDRPDAPEASGDRPKSRLRRI